MKFDSYETLIKKVTEHAALCTEMDQKRREGSLELRMAKKHVSELMDRQIAGEDVVDEIIRAKTLVEAAEEKYKRLIDEIGFVNPKLELKGHNLITLKSEIRSSVHNGKLYEFMKEEMDTLAEAKAQYLEAAEKVLIKFHEAQKLVNNAQKELKEITKEEVLGGFEILSMSALRPALWVETNDYHNDFYKVKSRADSAVNGPQKEVTGPKMPGDRVIKKTGYIPNANEHVDDRGVIWTKKPVEVK